MYLGVALAITGCESPGDSTLRIDQSQSAITYPGLNAALVSQNFPRYMAPNEQLTVTVVMRNTDTITWDTPDYCIRTMGAAPSVWGIIYVCLPAGVSVPNGSTYTWQLPITAINATGPVRHVWQMVRRSTLSFYGPRMEYPVDLVAGGGLDSAFVSQSLPSRVNAGGQATFNVTMRNRGIREWREQANVTLANNGGLWGTANAPLTPAPLDVVAPNSNHTFSFNVTAPAQEGSYTSDWRMRQAGTSGAGFFGENAHAECIDVSICGNGAAAYAEECDDGNAIDGDGCSATCTAERRGVDLANAPTERTFIGPFSARQLGNLAVGDVTNDGVPEVLVAAMGTVPSRPVRSNAGAIYGYTGGPAFFNAATDVVPANVAFQIWGADTNDRFAGGAHNGLFIDDVTGDGIPDIIASAERGDGYNNGVFDGGEIYVIRGGPGLSGVIDVRTDPRVVSRIYGRNPDDHIQVLATGDLTGDGFDDIVVGIPGFDGDENDQGAIAIVAGGPSLPALITSIGPDTSTAFVYGINEGDLFGYSASVGDISGDGVSDLVATAAYHRANGNAFSGGAWALFGGPFTGEYRLRDFADVTWYGRAVDDKLGSSVAIANFAGDSTLDVIIGVKAARRAQPNGARAGTVDIWTGPFNSGDVFNLATGGAEAEPTVRVLGAEEGDELGDNLFAGDINRDGVADLAIAAGYADSANGSMLDVGEVMIAFGEWCPIPVIDMANGSALSIYGNEPSARLGLRSGSIGTGDIDGDGLIDLCAGALAGGSNGTFVDPGRVDCIRGRW